MYLYVKSHHACNLNIKASYQPKKEYEEKGCYNLIIEHPFFSDQALCEFVNDDYNLMIRLFLQIILDSAVILALEDINNMVHKISEVGKDSDK